MMKYITLKNVLLILRAVILITAATLLLVSINSKQLIDSISNLSVILWAVIGLYTIGLLVQIFFIDKIGTKQQNSDKNKSGDEKESTKSNLASTTPSKALTLAGKFGKGFGWACGITVGLFALSYISNEWLKEKKLEYWDRTKTLAYQYQLANATPDHSKIVDYKKEGLSTIVSQISDNPSLLQKVATLSGAYPKGAFRVSVTGDNESTGSNLHGPGHQTGIYVNRGDKVTVNYIAGKICFNCYGDSGAIWGYSNLRGMKEGETMRYQIEGLSNAVVPILRATDRESKFPFREGSIQTSTMNPYDKAEIILFYNGKERYFSKLAGKFRDDGFLAVGVDGSRAEFIIQVSN